MRIGIIGAGKIGGTVGTLWAKAGHQVRFGTRHPEALMPLIETIGADAAAGTPEEAATFGEVVFCAAPYGTWPDLAGQVGDALSGKVVIDAANPYPERDGTFAEDAIRAGEGAGVPVARLLPGVRLVRAFNSVFWQTLEAEAHRAGDQVGIPLAGDDAQALAVVADLVRAAGFAPVMVGPLAEARRFDPGAPVYNTGLSGPELARALGIGSAADAVPMPAHGARA